MRRTVLLAALLLMHACSHPVDLDVPPDFFVLPEPDLSLDPARVAVGDRLATYCTVDFSQFERRREWVTVDVYLWPRLEDVNFEEPVPHVLDNVDVALIESAGVRVLARFQTHAVRGRILLSSLRELFAATSGRATVVHEVPNPARYDVPVIVGFSLPLDDTRLGAFVELGGQIQSEIDGLAMVSGGLPDRSIEAMRARYDVSFVETNSVACLAR